MTLAEQHLEGRDALVQALRDEVEAAALTRWRELVTVANEVGPDYVALDGLAVEGPPLKVLTRADLDSVLEAAFVQPLPPPVASDAEVTTPATIVVAAICPSCGIPGSIELTVEPVLEVAMGGGRHLKLKAKAKAKYHVCGQLELPARRDESTTEGEEEDQTVLPFRYASGEPPAPLGAPDPGAVDPPDPDDDLLPF